MDKKVFTDFAKIALNEHELADADEVLNLFDDNFKYWEEAHFERVDNNITKPFRNIFANKAKQPMLKGRGHRISK